MPRLVRDSVAAVHPLLRAHAMPPWPATLARLPAIAGAAAGAAAASDGDGPRLASVSELTAVPRIAEIICHTRPTRS